MIITPVTWFLCFLLIHSMMWTTHKSSPFPMKLENHSTHVSTAMSRLCITIKRLWKALGFSEGPTPWGTQPLSEFQLGLVKTEHCQRGQRSEDPFWRDDMKSTQLARSMWCEATLKTPLLSHTQGGKQNLGHSRGMSTHAWVSQRPVGKLASRWVHLDGLFAINL